MFIRNAHAVLFALTCFTNMCGFASAQGTSDDIRQKTGIEAGVCAILSAADGVLCEGLTNDGRMLVHVLRSDPVAVTKLRSDLESKGLYGLASAEVYSELSSLPYADNMVNLLISDQDQLGSEAPSEAEIMRVVVPEGVAYLRKGGAWIIQRKPMPAQMDDWTHWNHNADMNPLSHDKLVGVPTGIKWVAWYSVLANNGEGLHGASSWGARLAGGRAYQKLLFKESRTETWVLDARDAFNGVLLWNKKLDAKATRATTPRDIATDDYLYTTLGSLTSAGKTVALDGKTGAAIITFDKGGTWSNVTHANEATLAGSLLVQTSGDKINGLDAKTGELKWTYQDSPGLRTVFPTGSEKDNIVFAAIAETPTTTLYASRFPHIRVSAIVALDLAGKKLWRSTDFVGKGGGPNPYPLLSQLTYSNGKLAIFADGNYGDPMVGLLDASNGKCLWVNDYQYWKSDADPRPGIENSYFSTHPGKYFGQGLAFRDNELLIMTKSKIAAVNMLTGNALRLIEPSLPNNRCSRAYVTDDWFLIGFTCYINKESQFTFRNITRSTCGSGAVPGYGQIYYGPNGECGCANWLRTATSLSCESLPPTVQDNLRLIKTGLGKATSSQDASSLSAASQINGIRVVPSRRPVVGSKPIQSDWNNNDLIPASETTPVSSGDKSYIAVVNEHRMECRQSGLVVWSYTAGGRISGSSVLTNGLCIFGSHDGYVYAVDADDGKLTWRFLAARADRRIVAFSQIESASPVFGVTLHEGSICFSSGRQPEIDGGIYVWGLNPTTGAIVWKGVIATTIGMQSLTSKTFTTYKNRTINAPLVVESGVLKLGSITVDPKNPNTVGVRQNMAKKLPNGTPIVSLRKNGIAIGFPSALASPAKIEVVNLRGEICMTQMVYSGRSTLLTLNALSAGRYAIVIHAAPGSKPTALDVWVK